MSCSILSESKYLVGDLNIKTFESIFKQILEKRDDWSSAQFTFSGILSMFLSQFTTAGIFITGKLIKTESIGTYEDFTFVQLYEFPKYFLVVATYCGSCDGCVRNRYNDYDILPTDIIKYSDAMTFYKNQLLDVFKGIVLKSTIINNKADAMNEFQILKEQIYDEEAERHTFNF